MEKIPTAKELFDKMLEINDECTSTEMMIEFAKLHVEQALKEASENAKVQNIYPKYVLNEHDEFEYFIVNKDSILNSYPLENVK